MTVIADFFSFRIINLIFQDGRLKVNDQILAINNTDLVGLKTKDALDVVRRILSPDILKSKLSIMVKIGRNSEHRSYNKKNVMASNTSTLVNLNSQNIRTGSSQKKDLSRHNDSYIIATQFGIEKIPLEPNRYEPISSDSKINRSQSLKALQYLNNQNSDQSVLYKGMFLFDQVAYISIEIKI